MPEQAPIPEANAAQNSAPNAESSTEPNTQTHTAPNTEPAAPAGIAHPRTIRSFVLRAGRVTTGQSKALEQWGDTFLLPYQNTPPDYTAIFGRQAPLVLEIGFGMGDATAQIAATMPDTNFLCCEVHQPGVGALLKRIGEQGLSNIRICAHDAVEVIANMLPAGSLHGVHIFFPDPWHKTRHHKRRLIQPALVHALAQRLAAGGYIHCATDWQPYAEQIIEVLRANPLLANTSPHAHGYADKPHYRPQTKFERRGLRLGHGVWDLVFTRLPD